MDIWVVTRSFLFYILAPFLPFISTDSYIEVLDGSRVHPETYEWARKMAVDALEYDESAEDANPAGALEEILENPERLKDLDLDAFAEELERQVGDSMEAWHRSYPKGPNGEETQAASRQKTSDGVNVGDLILSSLCPGGTGFFKEVFLLLVKESRKSQTATVTVGGGGGAGRQQSRF